MQWIFDETKSVGVDYFDKNIANDYEQHHEKFRDFDKEATNIVNTLGLSNNSVVLDMGCGTGGLTIPLSKMCRHLYAVEPSDAMIDVVNKKIESLVISNITTIQGGLVSYEHKGDMLDAVILNIALHHLPDFWKQISLNKISQILKSGGKLFITDVVFSFNPLDYEKNINDWIDSMRATAGDKTADEMIIHVKDEYSTWEWIMSGMLEKAGFSIDSNTEIMNNVRVYICTKL